MRLASFAFAEAFTLPLASGSEFRNGGCFLELRDST
jgi:hypothetical protein